jgi:hypothetical protein
MLFCNWRCAVRGFSKRINSVRSFSKQVKHEFFYNRIYEMNIFFEITATALFFEKNLARRKIMKNVVI